VRSIEGIGTGLTLERRKTGRMRTGAE